MGYESGKIYRLQCSDGCFYIGSTITKLSIRYYHHKTASRDKNTPLYSHAKTIGWENILILLVEEFPCKNIIELRTRENQIIETEKKNPLCLNKNKAIVEEKDKNSYMKEYRKEYDVKNKEHISVQKREYKSKNKEHIRLKAQEYYQRNKERILLQQKEYHTKKKSISA